MPDATIATAFAAPVVAGAVAIVIHRQRLGHERRQSDLSTARELLAQGAELSMRLDRVARAWFNAPDLLPASPSEPPRTAERAGLVDAIEDWTTYLATIEVFFAGDHPVLVATEAVDHQLKLVALEVADIDFGAGRTDAAYDALHEMGQLFTGWRQAARDVVQATL